MPFRVIRIRRQIAAPVQAVFDHVANLDNYARLPGVRRARLLREGATERQGTGAEREIALTVGTLVERITEFDPPHRLAWRMIRVPFPIHHLGAELRLREVAGGTEIQWVSRFRARSPIGAGLIERSASVALTAVYGTALLFWKRSLEATHPRWRHSLPASASTGAPAASAPPMQRPSDSQQPRPRRLLPYAGARLIGAVRSALGLPGRLLRRRR
ncbi:MAG: SRPBCC family protein [Salinisphaeraceae bacterium]